MGLGLGFGLGLELGLALGLRVGLGLALTWPSAPAEASPPPDSAQSACSPLCPAVGRRVARSDGCGGRPSRSPLDHSSSPPSAPAEASRVEARGKVRVRV